jgi:hypothetical protein
MPWWHVAGPVPRNPGYSKTMKTTLLLGLLLLLPAVVSAQDADVLTGRVTSEDGQPVVNARVEAVSAETEITRSVLTDRNGRYTIVFPDGGGQYVLRISFLGYADVVQTLARDGEEELLLRDIRLTTRPIELEALEVIAQRPPPGRGQTGEQTTDLSQNLLNRLPLPDLDPNTIALLASGVVSTQLDSLSGRMGFSVAGMSDLLNQVVLDGVVVSEGGVQAPEEAVRRTQVTTSTFDASRGGFAGGQVSMTSARGNNRTAGSLSYQLIDDALQLRSSPSITGQTRHNIGASIGGPLVNNKLFYNASFQFVRNVDHRFALTADDPDIARASGVTADSITRFLSILNTRYLFPTSGQTGPYNQFRTDGRFAGRMDWNISQSTRGAHTLAARFNYNVIDNDSAQIRALDLSQHGGESENDNLLAAVTLTSRIGTRWTNALSGSFSEGTGASLPYLELPEGRVRVVSDFEDATSRTSSLVFGGNRSMPSEAYRKDLQLSDDLSLLLPVGSQLHRLKVGGALQKTRNVNRSADNIFGTFSFNSLEDFQNNRPARFERTLSDRLLRSGTLNAGLYVGDTWRITQPLELTFGVRWDRSSVAETPAYNPAIDAAFGRRSDIAPLATAFSPRLGFNYRVAAAAERGVIAKTLTGGIGLFAGRPPTQIYSQAARQTGLAGAEQQLICIGEAVPIPDWSLFLEDPESVPDTCAGGLGSSTDVRASRAPSVTLLEPDQKLPSSLRAEIGYRTSLPLKLSGNIRYTYSRGLGLWGYRDLNLDDTSSFVLGAENRPFFGDPADIVLGTGATSLAGSRLHPEFGNVFSLTSDRASNTHQVTMQAGGFLPARMTASANYTLSFARDQGSGSFAQTTTAGNPNEKEWATSSNDRRHTVNLTLARAFGEAFEITAITRISSGTPFTPIVDGDVNGDGARNDRAFVFDPAAASDSAIANGMTRLLAAVPGSIASCLESQLGRIATRNTCRNPWSQTLDLRASLRPNLPGVERRLTVSFDARNVLTGLDQLFHGAADMKGWGESARADASLLQVRGFDPVTNRFLYQVNEGFGQTNRGPNSFRNPFSLTISARLAIGGPAVRNNRGFGPPVAISAGAAGGGPGGPGGPGGRGGFDAGGFGGGFGGDGAREGIRALFQAVAASRDSIGDRLLANPVVAMLALRDSLQLTDTQAAALKTLADTLDVRLASQRAHINAALKDVEIPVLPGPGMAGPGGAGPGRGGFDPAVIQRMQADVAPALEAGRRETTRVLAEVQRALTAEQWQKLPATLRTGNVAAQTGAGGRGSFNAVGMLDRMLANPIPVLLTFKDTLKLTDAQVAGIREISERLEQTLAKHRQQMGDRITGAQQGEQGRMFQQLQPEIQAVRQEVTSALEAIAKLMTKEQWEQLPEQVRNPFRGQGRARG